MRKLKAIITGLASTVVALGCLLSLIVIATGLAIGDAYAVLLYSISLVIFIFAGVALAFPSRNVAIVATVLSGLLCASAIVDLIRSLHVYRYTGFGSIACDVFYIVGSTVVIIAVWMRSSDGAESK